MANTIQIKRSTGTSAPTGLNEGELAFIDNGTGGANGKLFIGDAADGTARHIGGRGTGAIGGGAASSLACDDLTVGDGAVALSTSSGNITIETQSTDSDIIFNVDDNDTQRTALTLDGSANAEAVFYSDIHVPGEVKTTKLSFTDGDDAITIADGGGCTFGVNTTLAGFVLDGNTITGVDDSGEFTDDDNHIMTSAGVNDRITGFGYTTLALGTSSSTALAGDTTVNDVSVANLKTRLAGGFGSNAVTIGDTNDVVTIGGSLDIGDGNIANVGDIDADSISVADAAAGLNIDFSGANTATSALTIGDNLAEALVITQGGNDYLDICTTDGSETVHIGHGVADTTITLGGSSSEVVVGDNLTVTGDLTVSGTTTTVTSTTVAIADSMLKLAKDQANDADALDFGFYGQYGDGTQKYAGVFRDLSATGDPFTFFDGLQVEPGTTVNTGGTGYDLADISAGKITSADGFVGDITGDVTGNINGNLTGTLQTAAQGNVTSLGTLTALTVDDIAMNGKVMTMTGSSGDTATFTVGTNGTLDITTVDTAAAAANMTLTADGTFEAVGSTITLDSGGAINLEPASGSAIVLDGTINVDAGVVTGATSITSTAFVGDITGDVTGNINGDLTGTLQTAAQGNVTSLGTLTALTVDDIAMNGKVMTMTGSSGDTATFTVGTNGTLAITTVDTAAAAANISITADGTFAVSSTGIDISAGGAIDNATIDGGTFS